MSANSTGVSTARTITAVSAAALTANASRGEATVTRPAPARNAPRAASRAAPVDAISPDTITAWPRAYLWPSMRGTGNDACQVSGTFSKVCGLISCSTRARCRYRQRERGRNASVQATGDAPACAGRRSRSRWRARHAHHQPVVPLMPLGRSTASTGAPLALIASIISCGSPLTGRFSPAPNSASTISAGLPIA